MGSKRGCGWGFVVVIGMIAVIGCKPSPSEKFLQECDQAEARGEIDEA